MHPTYLVVDDFLPNPGDIRSLALRQEYRPMGSAGQRSTERFLEIVNPLAFERMLDIKIQGWEEDEINGRFQFCTAKDALVYHSDLQQWAATLFLTPDAPPESGLTLLRSRRNRLSFNPGGDEGARMYGNFRDPTLWDEVDRIGNRYNRLVMWNARHAHTASCYFGNAIENARLFMVFFFNGGHT